jgi:hydroxylamine dehydrogenase
MCRTGRVKSPAFLFVHTCGECPETQVKQFKGGKHALDWAAMKAMPTIHWQPMAMTDGMKGCGACHKIGLKSLGLQA